MLRPELCATKLSTMNHSAAEERLRVIRELMERATIYRAVSAPAALFCGLMALLVSGLALIPGPLQSPFQHYFVLVWVVVCVLSATANIFFLSRCHGAAPGTVCLLSVTGRPCSAIAPAFIVAIALDLLPNPGGGDGTLYRGLLDGVVRAGAAVDDDIGAPVNRRARLGVHPDQRCDPVRDDACFGTRCFRPAKRGAGTKWVTSPWLGASASITRFTG